MAEELTEPTCTVKIVNGKYEGVIVSNKKRIPDAIFSVDVPQPTPIEMDSWFNTCIINQDRTPVAETEVVIYGEDWEVRTVTSGSGCFDAQIPAETEFTFKAMNPETKEWTDIGGTIMSAPKGTLLADEKEKVMPYDDDLINISHMEPEEGIVSHSFGGEEYKVRFKGDLEIPKHSMVVIIPTKIGEEYTVTISIDEPLKVYFSDEVRVPAILVNPRDGIVLNSFFAKKSITKLWLQPQNINEITIKNLTMKETKD